MMIITMIMIMLLLMMMKITMMMITQLMMMITHMIYDIDGRHCGLSLHHLTDGPRFNGLVQYAVIPEYD